MAIHTEIITLRYSSVSRLLDFPLTVAALAAIVAECFLSSKNDSVFNFLATAATVVCAITTFQIAIIED